MLVEARARFLGTVHHNGHLRPEFEIFDPQDEPLLNITPGEGVEDFQPIRAHRDDDFKPSTHADPSSEAVLAFNNGRHP